jgi:hypothetical protein
VIFSFAKKYPGGKNGQSAPFPPDSSFLPFHVADIPRLSDIYGKSFSSRNLLYMRQFNREFSKWNAVRSELSWIHYRLLLKVENENRTGIGMLFHLLQHEGILPLK